MSLDLNIMIGGEAGQGIQTMGYVVSKMMMRGGFEVFSDQDFESRIRGGHSFFRIRTSDKKVMSHREKLNILLALNKETVDLHSDEMEQSSFSAVIFDGTKTGEFKSEKTNCLDIPMERLAIETTVNKLMSNTVALGALTGLIDYDLGILSEILREVFIERGDSTANDNIKAAKAGYEYVQKHKPSNLNLQVKTIGKSSKILMNGNDALSVGAMAAGCKFLAGYPMTPTTSIFEYIAGKSKDHGILVIQAEDEISAINMVIGASYAGVRSMTATSGGGFCLMVEGISLAGMTETPVVVVLGQRPGPAIGLPTRTEQGELEFAISSGHGEFPRAVLAPANADDAFWLTVKAFNLAEKYQTPVIILTDHNLANSYETIDDFDFNLIKIERGDLVSADQLLKMDQYKRYVFSDSGVSPRAFPGQGKALIVADSDEHNETGHIIEDADTRNKMMIKRMKKMDGIKTEISNPRIDKCANPKYTLVGFGSTYGPIKEAAEVLRANQVDVNTLHFNQVWPFPAKAAAACLAKTKCIVVENNATAQLSSLIRKETGIKTDYNFLKYDGRPFSSELIIRRFQKEVS